MDDLPSSSFFMQSNQSQHRSGLFRWLGLCLGLIGIIIVVWIIRISTPPSNFQKDTIITVYSGMSVKDLGTLLEGSHIIRSEKFFRLILSMRWKSKPIMVGDYIFERPQSAIVIAYRMTHGIYGNSRIRVTFPEGITIKTMGDILSKNIPGFPVSDFLASSNGKEGFLFPDTYYFFRTQPADQVIMTLSNQFEKKMKTFADDFEGSVTKEKKYGKNRSVKDIITMASILEREANDAKEAKVISGILWKRMQKNIALQVDATFLYTINKGTSSLTVADLKKDSPYNTYTRTGLPVGPIGNPGSAMIDAALHPIDSDYWYYLHDSNGTVHYAKSYQEHLANKRKYLK
jgi:UPF0755 protein